MTVQRLKPLLEFLIVLCGIGATVLVVLFLWLQWLSNPQDLPPEQFAVITNRTAIVIGGILILLGLGSYLYVVSSDEEREKES